MKQTLLNGPQQNLQRSNPFNYQPEKQERDNECNDNEEESEKESEAEEEEVEGDEVTGGVEEHFLTIALNGTFLLFLCYCYFSF